MIYVTHDQVEAMTLADRIVVLRQGRIEQMGTPAQLYDNPANTFVARFFGTPEMNLIDGKMIEAGWFSGDGIPFRVHVPGFADQLVTLACAREDLHLHKADGTSCRGAASMS